MRRYGYFRVASAIPNVKVGDCFENAQHIEALIRKAQTAGAEVVLFPELCLSGYTCGDLFLQSTIVEGCERTLGYILEKSADLNIAAIVSLPLSYNSRLYNCAVMINAGRIIGAVPKIHIPNYSEFYEARWFSSGRELNNAEITLCNQKVVISTDHIFKVNGVGCAIEICEDMWVPTPPSSRLSAAAEVIFNPSASPEVVGKHDYLQTLISQQSARCIAGYVYASSGFGESSTDLVFGGNAIIYENGSRLRSGDRFSIDEQLVIADIDVDRLRNMRRATSTYQTEQQQFIYNEVKFGLYKQSNLLRPIDKSPFVPQKVEQRQERCREILSIQIAGLAQRLRHTRCKCAVVGISGGLDSTLALLVTVYTFDKLGLDRKGIIGVTMPGFGTTGRTYNNAMELMRELGITIREISIRDACMQHFKDIGLSEHDRSVTYENSQARERTQILMDISNLEGGMVIGTGDLSELALGWATYNGDQMSMYGVNASVPKTLIRYLVGWVADSNSNPKICDTLRDIIDTPVSPELLPADESGEIAQKTEDLVGPYELHDFFLYNFVRQGFSTSKIYDLAKRAFANEYDAATIKRWLTTFVRRFFSQQFKRSAMPDGPKVGSVTLSPRGDWRMPSDASADMWLHELEGDE